MAFRAKRDLAVVIGCCSASAEQRSGALHAHRFSLVHVHAIKGELRALKRCANLLFIVLGHRNAVAVAARAGRDVLDGPGLSIGRGAFHHARKLGGIGKGNLVARISAWDDLILDLEVFLIGHVEGQLRARTGAAVNLFHL